MTLLYWQGISDLFSHLGKSFDISEAKFVNNIKLNWRYLIKTLILTTCW
ncbi:hypothetical protein [Spiroplasma poulsonii]|nr:hypothetical protein [Spiroplasma poulsonii]UNF61795.1 hypothetical protein MNU24_07745 [Spiroplasma poulsonii]